ncbi:MAG: hypothetical protein WC423_16750 [Vulcanimicrobiota bacterium]
MTEQARRLAPKRETLRELFAKSGNECAFPGCCNRIIDADGNLVGQLCHIEAAEAGGERFNVKMSNEERRGYDNLLLLCYHHHVVTNDVGSFPVSRMRQMKADHELRFARVDEKLLGRASREILDEEQKTRFSPAVTLAGFLGEECEDEYARETRKQLDKFFDKLRRIPRLTRQVFVVMVKRSRRGPGFFSREVTWPELRQVLECNYSSQEEAEEDLWARTEMLNQYGFCSGDYNDHYRRYQFQIHSIFKEWDGWEHLMEYCEQKGLSLDSIMVDLRLDLLD